MAKKISIFFFFSIFVFLLSGCAATHRNMDLENQGLRNQISVLEAQIQSKDEEIAILKEFVNKATVEKEALIIKEPAKDKVCSAMKCKLSAKQVQVALKNAGYNPGKSDGKIGRQTKEAIKAFQKANNLAVTGKTDKETCSLLRGYLDKKIK